MSSVGPLGARIRAGMAAWCIAQTMIVGTVFWIGTMKLVTGILPFGETIYDYYIVVKMKKLWFSFAACLIQDFLRSKITLYAESEEILEAFAKNTDDLLIISNHLTRLDWFFLWPVLCFYDRLSELKIILKDMSNIPFFGWATSQFRFIFLRRTDAEKDLKNIEENLIEERRGGGDTTLLIFPEGTDRSDSNIKKSIEFQVQKNDPIRSDLWYHTLIPKKAGFIRCVEAMLLGGQWCSSDHKKSKSREENTVKNDKKTVLKKTFLIDLTMCYEGTPYLPNEKEVFLKGLPPKEIRIRVEGMELKEEMLDIKVSNRESEISQYLMKSFQRKEDLFRDYVIMEDSSTRNTTRIKDGDHSTNDSISGSSKKRPSPQIASDIASEILRRPVVIHSIKPTDLEKHNIPKEEQGLVPYIIKKGVPEKGVSKELTFTDYLVKCAKNDLEKRRHNMVSGRDGSSNSLLEKQEVFLPGSFRAWIYFEMIFFEFLVVTIIALNPVYMAMVVFSVFLSFFLGAKIRDGTSKRRRYYTKEWLLDFILGFILLFLWVYRAR